ncbi:hypothetical protein XBLMG947_2791 [Xanthomonas bromi]|uniref:Uncharacterized protein n=1 Tax=Xanthomonas bromi TaxID=56449 RepID=A0A1C3NNP6_9XANT|nr:hypothetical protein XBLMG947_2791 [Xanthomonas bromi]
MTTFNKTIYFIQGDVACRHSPSDNSMPTRINRSAF